jgi:nicotinamidase/pyrazinamidase
MDNTQKLKTPLETVLLENSVDIVSIVGLMTNYCTYFSVIDALSLGVKVSVILDATRGISEDGVTVVVADMKVKGAIITDSATVLNMMPLFWSNRKVDLWSV